MRADLEDAVLSAGGQVWPSMDEMANAPHPYEPDPEAACAWCGLHVDADVHSMQAGGAAVAASSAGRGRLAVIPRGWPVLHIRAIAAWAVAIALLLVVLGLALELSATR